MRWFYGGKKTTEKSDVWQKVEKLTYLTSTPNKKTAKAAAEVAAAEEVKAECGGGNMWCSTLKSAHLKAAQRHLTPCDLCSCLGMQPFGEGKK